MMRNNTIHNKRQIFELILQSHTADKLIAIALTSLKAYEKEAFMSFFGIGRPKQDIDALAQATGRTSEETEAILERLMLKLRKHPDAAIIWESAK